MAWGPPQPKNIETSDAPDMSDYFDDYEQGNLLSLKDAGGGGGQNDPPVLRMSFISHKVMQCSKKILTL